jgi:GrpB-like predicted nucleotidyltransferase (UPF0157 family)
MDLVREDEIRGKISAVFERQRARLRALVPAARIEHVGSTAIAGALTKGDLDICVLVDAPGFLVATETLSAAYLVHQPENWTEGLASFIAPPEDGIEIGIQLVTLGGVEEEWFIGWRERLRSDPALRARYDRCKEEHRDAPVEAYRESKERLILG